MPKLVIPYHNAITQTYEVVNITIEKYLHQYNLTSGQVTLLMKQY
jgi:hypothetical protein